MKRGMVLLAAALAALVSSAAGAAGISDVEQGLTAARRT